MNAIVLKRKCGQLRKYHFFTNCLFSVKWSALKTYIQVALYGLEGFYLCTCIYIHGITVKKRGHEFEGE